MRLKLAALLFGFAVPAFGLTASDDHPVTFTKDVAPILFNNCVTCHRPGEVAPFSLKTYEEAKKHARQMARVTEDKLMPPWKADAGAEVFKDARLLTAAQIQTIRRWVEQG